MIDKSGWPPNAYDSNCPTRQVLDRVADKWTVLILLLLARKPTRFNELRRADRRHFAEDARADITHAGARWAGESKSDRDRAGDGGIFHHRARPHAQFDRVDALRKWAEKHIADVTAAQLRYDKTAPRVSVSRASAR